MLTNAQLRQIAEGVVSVDRWLTETAGLCKCPGLALHTNLTGMRDCKVMLAPETPGRPEAPTIYCLHRSCAERVAEANRVLRSAIGRAKSGSQRKAGGLGGFRILPNAAPVPAPSVARVIKPWLPTCKPPGDIGKGDEVSPSISDNPDSRDGIFQPTRARAHTHAHVTEKEASLPSEPERNDVTWILGDVAIRTHVAGGELKTPIERRLT